MRSYISYIAAPDSDTLQQHVTGRSTRYSTTFVLALKMAYAKNSY